MSDWDADGEPVPITIAGREAAGDDRSPREAPRDPEALDELVADLERTMRELRTEVEGPGRRRRRGRREITGLPRPPTARELLRFTETYTIPTAVALLEAAIRALELLAGTIRLLDGRDPRPPERRDHGSSVLADVSTAAGERAAASGREALARVDDALAELQRSYEGEPEDPAARRLLADARELRDEIDDRLSTIERSTGNGDGGDDGGADRGPSVDVDAELASLKEQAGRGDGDQDDDGDPGPDSNDCDSSDSGPGDDGERHDGS